MLNDQPTSGYTFVSDFKTFPVVCIRTIDLPKYLDLSPVERNYFIAHCAQNHLLKKEKSTHFPIHENKELLLTHHMTDAVHGRALIDIEGEIAKKAKTSVISFPVIGILISAASLIVAIITAIRHWPFI